MGINVLLPAQLGRSFRWLWGGATVANLGDGLMLSAGPLLVASVTLNPVLVSLAVIVQRLPWVCFGVLAGAVVDRVDRKRLVIIVDLLRAVVLAALAGTVATGVVQLPLVYLILFLLGSAETFADNAAGTLMASVVPAKHLGVANSRLYGAAIVTNQLAGPPLGAFLFAAGLWLPFAADAACFALATVLVSRIGWEHRARAEVSGAADPSTRLRTEMAEGLRWLWRHPPVRTLAVMITVFNVTFGAAFAIWVLYARQRLGLGEVGFGLLITASAGGGLIGSVIYGRLERRFSLATLLRAGLVIETGTHAVLALTTWWPVAAVVMVLFGCHAVVWGTTSTTVRQRAVPNQLLGRVTGVYLLGSVGGGVLGTAVGGAIAQVGGITAPFWFAFLGSGICTVLIWRSLANVAHAAEPEPEPA